MSDKCPECDCDLVQLYIAERRIYEDQYGTFGGHDVYVPYGCWCPNQQKMYINKHNSLTGSIKE